MLLAGKSPSSVYLFNCLSKDFFIASVVVEKGVKRSRFLSARARKLGVPRVLGQILFQALIVPWLRRISRRRIAVLSRTFGFSDTPIPEEITLRVESVNGRACIDHIRAVRPDLILISGTRILKRELLECTDAVFVNIHTGITPAYRGVHGGYWALANNDPGNCGVTVHEVDPGIDTGRILAQKRITPTVADNFVTYPYLQLGEGIGLLKIIIAHSPDASGSDNPRQGMKSKLWYHPTIWYYLNTRMKKGVK